MKVTDEMVEDARLLSDALRKQAPVQNSEFRPAYSGIVLVEFNRIADVLDSLAQIATRYQWMIEKDWIQTELDYRLGVDTETVEEQGLAIDSAIAAQRKEGE